MNYQPVTAGNQSNLSAGVQEQFDAEKAGEERVQQYVLFLVWSSGSTNPHNTDVDAAFEHDDKTKREAKGKSLVVSSTGYRNLSVEFEDFSDNSINKDNAVVSQVLAVGQISTNSTNTFSDAGPSNAVVSLTHGKSSYVDSSQLPDDPNMPELEDITYSDDEYDVGAEADFNNLETSITKVWVLVDLLHGKRAIGHTQEEGIDYEEVFALVARIEAIRLFLAYASFMGFMVYQMDVKSSFLGKIDQTLFIKWKKGDILLVQIYVDDIIFGSTNKDLCKAFEKLMKDKFQMSSIGELTFFLGLQVKQKKDGIFISHDRYVAEILRKLGLIDGKSASTPIDTKKPLLKDPDGEDVDMHTYRSMIGSLMYLTSSRLDIMFAVCSCARFQMTPKASHLHAVKSIFRYLKGKPHLGLWYPKDSPFNLVAYSNSDYKHTVVATSSTKAEYIAAVNDVTRLQALVDKKKVVISEATIRDALRLDDAEGIDYLPNEEIFTELVRMGYEKPSTKLTFYKAFFSSQWKFLIHTILQCMSTKRTSWNEFSSSMASAVICLSTSRKFNFSRYIFDSLVRNVDSLTKFYMVGKWCSGVETTLFEGMIVAQQVGEDADEVNVDDVHVAGIADKGAASVNDDVPAAVDEPSIPLPMPSTQPPPTSQDIPSTSQDKIAQDLEITKLKQRVKKLERRNKLKASELRRLKKVGTAQKVETSDDTVMDDVSKHGRMITDMDVDVDVTLKDIAKDVAVDAETEESADVQGRQAKSQAQIYQIDLEHADKVLSMQDDKVEPAELQEVVEVVTTAKLITEVVTASATITIAAPQLTTAVAPTLTTAPSAARRRKGVILVEEPKPLKKKAKIEQDEAYARELEAELNKNIDWDEVINHVQIKEKEDNAVKRYQALKRKPQSEAQAKKNMMIYLRNKKKEQMEEEDSRALKRINLEVLWELVKERFASSKPKNFLDDFLLTTLTYMFEKPDVQTHVWKNQRTVHGLTKVKSWKLLESCGVHIITFTSTQMILLVERRYLLTRFTLDQMLNNVRLEVEEESEVSLELLRFIRQQQQEGFRLE
nr:hypothetical protein [Tanacetum cinerariifolium]